MDSYPPDYPFTPDTRVAVAMVKCSDGSHAEITGTVVPSTLRPGNGRPFTGHRDWRHVRLDTGTTGEFRITALRPTESTVNGEQYMQILLARQAEYEAENPPNPAWMRPLLEWFIREGDEKWVDLSDEPSMVSA